MQPLNIFYQEPESDRWLPYDRYPRKLIRRIVRGEPRPGGQMMVALELMKGLDKIGVPYRFNDFKYAKKHPEELVCIIGKPTLVYERKWSNPILFGASIFAHPLECPDLLERYPQIKRVLVPGEWMRKMFEPYFGDKVTAWPVGIDTEKWSPQIKQEPQIDFVIYDKVRWKYDHFTEMLIKPVKDILKKKGQTFETIRYGQYKHQDLISLISKARAVIFLCEHETQGLAYQQILSTNTPMLAWDRGGFWEDPVYFPNQVNFEPVSSVPYWDERCGLKFRSAKDFDAALDSFLTSLKQNKFSPRSYITENLSLEHCAKQYVEIAHEVITTLK